MIEHQDGPAFPVLLNNDWSKPQSGFANDEVAAHHSRQYSGMMLRDYFAAKAMAAFIIRPDTMDDLDVGEIEGNRHIIAASYEMADAMLAARGAA